MVPDRHDLTLAGDPTMHTLRPVLSGLLFGALLASSGLAQSARTQTVSAEAAAAGTILEGSLKGDETADYVVAGAAGQTLSVDLSASNAGLYFNILPEGQQEALFVGSTSGNVADIPLPAPGNYVVQVYLMRNAARRDEGATYSLGIGLAGADFADGLAGGPDWWQVTGITEGALNIRSGPDTRYDVVGKAQNGEAAQNRGCRMTGQTRWCSVRIDGSGVQGWVAGRYLVEGAAPAMAGVAAGGPKGNGVPFDATGEVSCATVAGAAMGSCLFGVVRDGPGNAGVWIALGDGTERAILFEAGVPVSADSPAPLSFTKDGDLFTISVGDERYQFPEALVNGG
jgi:Bacterial SH3 domain